VPSDAPAVLRRLSADLARHGADAALVGGFAFSLRVRPRMTKDVDFSVAVSSDLEAELLVGALLREGYRHGAILENVDTGRLARHAIALIAGRGFARDKDLPAVLSKLLAAHRRRRS
jgi:hypothetical protein